MAHSTSGLKVILLLGRSYGGGTEAHATWLCEALCQSGVAAQRYTLFPHHRITGFAEEALEMLMLRKAYRHFTLYAQKQQPDLVICFGRVAHSIGHLLLKDLPNTRLIATCRTNRYLPKAYRKTLTVADAVLVNSNWAADRVRRLPGLGEKVIKMIPNALLRPDLLAVVQNESSCAQARHELGLETSKPVLCMLAHFVPGKNQEELISMLAKDLLPSGTQILLVGEGPRFRRIKGIVKRLGVADRVYLLGRREKFHTVFQASDLVVSTSLRDSLPNALVEAQAAGLPVVAYDVAGVGEAFLHGQSGQLIPRGDESGFALAVCQLLKDHKERASYSRVAKEQVLARFMPEHVLADYLRLLDSLMPA